eukprot:scaffold42554_cov153-Amphora_coffeaeformis.AAC.1
MTNDTISLRAVEDALECPISHERMKDPVILCCRDEKQKTFGHVYDKAAICQSLLERPTLDPLSNTQYKAPLYLMPSRLHQTILQGSGLYDEFTDERFQRAVFGCPRKTFQEAYDAAWNRRVSRPIRRQWEAAQQINRLAATTAAQEHRNEIHRYRML